VTVPPVYTLPLRSLHEMNAEVTYQIPIELGVVFVILCMDCFIAGVGGGAIQINDSNGATFWYNAQGSDTAGVWMQWLGHESFIGPDYIEATATVLDPLGHGDLRITGYQLANPS